MAEENTAEKPEAKPAPAPEQKPAPAPAAGQAPAAAPAGGSTSSVPFILSLVGGILILISGIILAAFGSLLASISAMVPGAEAITGLAGMMYIPLVLGIIVLVGAILMRNPGKKRMASILVLICSIVSLVTILGSGFFIGAILGIIGGALGLKG